MNVSALLELITDPGRMLLFSPEAYESVLARYNHDTAWASVAAGLAGVAVLALLLAGRRVPAVASFGFLAVAWAWLGLAFYAHYYRAINWAADAWAVLAVLQGMTFAAFAVSRRARGVSLDMDVPGGRRGAAWLTLAIGWAPVAWLLGADPAAVPYFATGPGPLAWATLAVLLLSQRRLWWLALFAFPLAVIEGATAFLLGDRVTFAVWLLAAATLLSAPFGRQRA